MARSDATRLRLIPCELSDWSLAPQTDGAWAGLSPPFGWQFLFQSTKLAVVLGELKRCEDTALGKRIWIRHMPDLPLQASNCLWKRAERVFGPLFEARDAGVGVAVRLIVAALIRARCEQTYEVESLSMMLVSEHWIPVEGVHELPLIQALVAQRRRFVKPLRYEARSAAGFANALLTDAGPVVVPPHVLSPFMPERERMAKERAIAANGAQAWMWSTEQSMPLLPASR